MPGKEIVLNHETRRMIYEHIKLYPGVTFNVLKQIFGIKDSTLRYHLNYLKRSEKIKFSETKGIRYYFPARKDTVIFKIEKEKIESYILTPIQEQILDIIKEHPRINQKELVRTIRMNRFTIRIHLKKLLDLCIIKKIKDKKNVHYEYITQNQLQNEILLNLILQLLNKKIDEKTFKELKAKLD